MIDYSKFEYVLTTSDDLHIFDTGVNGVDFGNNGFGEDVKTKMLGFIDNLIGNTFEYQGNEYKIQNGEIMSAFIGWWGSILIGCKKL